MVLFIIWIGLSFLVAFAGNGKKIGYGGTFLLSLLLSPLIGLIIALVSGSAEPIKKVTCDGCRKPIIKGDYIRITPVGTKDQYDYCSKECRNEFHPKYMKEKGIEWIPSN